MAKISALPYTYKPSVLDYTVVLVVDHDGALIPLCEAVSHVFETTKDWHDAHVHGMPLQFPGPNTVWVRAEFINVPPMLHDGLWIYVLQDGKEMARGVVTKSEQYLGNFSASARMFPMSKAVPL